MTKTTRLAQRFARASALAAIGAGLAFAPSANAQVVAGPEVNWNFSTWGKSRAFTVGAETLAAELDRRTGGKFTFKVNYGEALSKSRENLDSLKLDAIQAAHFCNFYHPDKNPGHMVFALPFLPLGDWDTSVYVRQNMYHHPAMVNELARWNAVAYASTHLPQYEFLGRGSPPKTINDWKGLRVRAGGGVGDAMVALGATKVTVTATEVYTAMQRGTMDAASFPYTYAHAAYRVHETANWYTSNLSPGTSECPLVFNRRAYNALPPQYKRLLREVRSKVTQAQIDAYVDVDKVNIPLFAARLTEIKYSPATLKAFHARAAKPAYEKFIATFGDRVPAQELIDQVFAFAEAAKALKRQGSLASYAQ